jgi:hypothetical protein
LTPQSVTAQPKGGDAEERRWQGSSKRADSAIFIKNVFNTLTLQENLINTQPFQFIARGAVTVRRTLEDTMGISVIAETPVFR